MKTKDKNPVCQANSPFIILSKINYFSWSHLIFLGWKEARYSCTALRADAFCHRPTVFGCYDFTFLDLLLFATFDAIAFKFHGETHFVYLECIAPNTPHRSDAKAHLTLNSLQS